LTNTHSGVIIRADDILQRRKNKMFVDETTESLEYAKGFDCGYKWLASGRWNFLHPSASYTYPNGRKIYGYIPGGPSYFIRASVNDRDYSKKLREETSMKNTLAKAWCNGWIDGINKYVRTNNLSYPQVVNER